LSFISLKRKRRTSIESKILRLRFRLVKSRLRLRLPHGPASFKPADDHILEQEPTQAGNDGRSHENPNHGEGLKAVHGIQDIASLETKSMPEPGPTLLTLSSLMATIRIAAPAPPVLPAASGAVSP
jgi:hypothetical protein